jgi:hypothetical protein
MARLFPAGGSTAPWLLALSLACALAQPPGARAQGQPQADAPSLVVAIYTKPADRPRLRGALAHRQAARLAAWRKQGVLSAYRLLFTRYADAGVWDALEVLTFRDEAALARWNRVERRAPGGLPADVLAAASQIVTTPADRVRSAGGPRETANPVFLAIPYQALVSTPDYLKYLDGYTLPQFQGWMSEGVLDGYDIELSRYPADRPWLAMILLRYRDDAALSRRDETTAKVRARLAQDPAWKAISDNKKAVRVEKTAAVAEQLAAAGEAR